MSDWQPSYLALHRSGELAERADRAVGLLGEERCEVCPRLCKVDRLADRSGLCGVGRRAVVASCFPHLGEEDCLRGTGGSGTIFFSGCNLRCVFCQNWSISRQVEGEQVTATRLAAMMLELQQRRCHNINWVTPEHVVPQILEAMPQAAGRGLRLPIVYNTSAYDSLDSLRLMDGVVDVYMPDLKMWTAGGARRYLGRRDYPEVARRNIREMQRQVGDLVLDDRGVARRGLLIRHLVMPGLVDETEAVLRFVAEEVGRNAYVNLMAQYRPAGQAAQHGEINRTVHRREYERALEVADALGLRRLDPRSRAESVLLATGNGGRRACAGAT